MRQAATCPSPSSGDSSLEIDRRVYEAQVNLWFQTISALREESLSNGSSTKSLDQQLVRNYFPLYLLEVRNHGVNKYHLSKAAKAYNEIKEHDDSIDLFSIHDENSFRTFSDLGTLYSFGFVEEDIASYQVFNKCRNDYLQALEQASKKVPNVPPQAD